MATTARKTDLLVGLFMTIVGRGMREAGRLYDSRSVGTFIRKSLKNQVTVRGEIRRGGGKAFTAWEAVGRVARVIWTCTEKGEGHCILK